MSMVPTRKVGGGALAGAFVTIIISISESVGYLISPDMAAALTVLATFAVSYFIPDAEVKTDA